MHNCPYCNIEAESSVKHNGTKASCFPPTDFKEPLRQHNSMVADIPTNRAGAPKRLNSGPLSGSISVF